MPATGCFAAGDGWRTALAVFPFLVGFVVADDDLEAEVFDHLEVVFRGLALGGEVIADEHRVRRVEAHCLHRAQVHFAAAGNAEFRLRIRHPEQA